ncbi:MAG: exo-alpha-sialidase [Candidatus Kerfeldbacteria bacterium]|nr:exo-alpha-sialidase [Candidatus Kerfeldbacteria bacterium]
MKKIILITLGGLGLVAVIVGVLIYRNNTVSTNNATLNTVLNNAVTTTVNTISNTNTTNETRTLDEHSCNLNQLFTPPPDENNLNDITLYASTSQDGITFSDEIVFVEGGGVPSVTAGADGTLVAVFNWFPVYADNPECYNKVAIQTSDDGGQTWDGPYGLYVEDFPENYQLPFDPTITTTADGQYRLFFTTHVLGMEEPFVYGTALSADGLHYTYDGIAFQSDEYDVVDGSEVRVGDTWTMIAPMAKQNGAALQATSDDGQTFTAVDSDRPAHSIYWVGNMVNVDGTIRFYGSCGIDSGEQGLCFSSTTDGITWSDAIKTNVPPSDPGIAYTADGTFVIIYPEPNTMTLPEDSNVNKR